MKFLSCSLIALFIIITSESKAQNYIPFPDESAIWTNKTIHFGGQPVPLLVITDFYCMGMEDTLINAVNYTKVNLCGMDYHGAMRDNGGQVFFVPKDSISELLIYDFTKSAGDTIYDTYFEASSGGEWYSVDLIVEITDSVLIGSEYHDRIVFLNMSADWIEGIGSTHGIFKTPYYNTNGIVYDLNCMSSSNVTLYPTYGSGTCSVNVSVNEIDFTEEIQVSPNPTSGSITVSSDGKLFSFELCDITGKVLLVSDEEMAVANINLESHEAGVYLLRVQIGDQVKSLRVVKE